MEPVPQQHRTIDVTGLPEEAIQAVEYLIAQLRGQHTQPPAAQPGLTPYSSYEEWAKAFRDWIASHQPQGTSADWSRESIYGEDRE
jgi:hypothetical protein